MYLRADGYDLRLTRGRTFEASVIVYLNNAVYELQSGDKLRFGVKRSQGERNLEISKTVTSADSMPNGGYKIRLAPADTEGLPSGLHIYDISLVSGADIYEVIPPSRFELVDNVT